MCLSRSLVSDSATPWTCNPPGYSYSVHGDSPGESTGVACHALLITLNKHMQTQDSTNCFHFGKDILVEAKLQ